MRTIGFWTNQLGERGTEIASFDYAYYNQAFFNNKSIIFYEKNNPNNKQEAIEKFSKHFEVFGVNDFSEVDDILLKYNADFLYVLIFGFNEGKVSKVVKTGIHCVFNCTDPHGTVYALVSPNVHGNNGQYPIVPHMINLPNHDRNMRKQLNIPDNAIVFGRHGGIDAFDIPYVKQAVYNVALKNPNIYFLFLHTHQFCPSLPNIIHIPMTVDLDKKVEFINTCDAMIWGRKFGESFGLSIAEFSTKNKPVFCCITGDTAHIDLLKDKAIIYDENNIEYLLTNFNFEEARKKDWNAYRNYQPEKVMKIFKEVFLDA